MGFPGNPNGSLATPRGCEPGGQRPGLDAAPRARGLAAPGAGTLDGEWGDLRRKYFRARADLDGPGPGRRFFLSMHDYMRWRREHPGAASPAPAAGAGAER